MKHYVLTIALLIVASLAYGQKANQKAAKTASETDEADLKKAVEIVNNGIGAINKAMNDETTKNDPETYNIAGKLYRKLYEIESMKALKKEAIDTVRLYNSVLEMFKYYNLCNEKAQLPDAKGKIPKNKWFEENQKDMEKFHDQLFSAGAAVYLVKKKDYEKAIQFLTTYLDEAEGPMLKDKNLLTDSAKYQTAFYTAFAAYYGKDYKNVIKYGKEAIQTANENDVETAYQILTHAYKAVGDTLNWINMLQEGIKRNPAAESNIVQLINYYNDKGKGEEAMGFADQLIKNDPDNDYSYFIKGVLLQGSKKIPEAIESYKKAIEINPQKAEYYSNIGTCYIAVAQDIDSKSDFKDKSQQKNVMQNYIWARENFEKVRELSPEKEDLWVAPLYRIYYKLGIKQGEEFQELQKKMDVREGKTK